MPLRAERVLRRSNFPKVGRCCSIPRGIRFVSACSSIFLKIRSLVCFKQHLYKGAFFLLQLDYYLNYDVYLHTKKVLLQHLIVEEREILSIGMSWHEHVEQVYANPDEYFARLLRWLSKTLNTTYVS